MSTSAGPAGVGSRLSISRPDAGLWPRLLACWQLTKPGITRLVVFTTAASFYMASRVGLDLVLLIHAVFGTALVASGANAFNQYAERDADARMARTARRPLPTGRLSDVEALVFATTLSVIGLVYLWLTVNPVTTGVVAASILTYILVYTPLKRRTWLATLTGAVPGALPALAGWTAATGMIEAGGLALFTIVFVWQMPHFFALGWMYREDYLRGGFRMLSAHDPAGFRTARQTVLYTLVLLPISLLPTVLGLAGWIYAAGAVVLGLFFLVSGTRLLRDRERGHAQRVFVASIVYLPALLGLMVIDKV